MLYTGHHVLQGIIDDVYYNHFLAFSVACSLLIVPQLVQRHADFARQLLQYFVSAGKTLYGEGFLVYNVHSLLHLADDAQQYGCSENAAGFPFENHLQKIKKMVRSGRRPLVQTVKHLQEIETEVPMRAEPQENAIRVKYPNNAYIVDDDSCVLLISQCRQNAADGARQYNCHRYRLSESLFDQPCSSKVLGILRFRPNRRPTVDVVSENQLKMKAIKYNTPEGIVFHAILHQL